MPIVTCDVYILGAGFSKWIDDQMPLTKEIGDNLRNAGGNEDVAELLDRFGSFEAALSFLAAPPPFVDDTKRLEYSARYRALANFCAIRVNFVEGQVRAGSRNGVPASLARLVSHWTATHPSILTLNYDTLIEAAFVSGHAYHSDQRALYPADLAPVYAGSVTRIIPQPRPFSVYKLHGSLNWYTYLDDHAAEIRSSSVGRWPTSDAIGNDVRIGRDRFIVPPSFSKSVFLARPLIRYLWQEAATKLSEAQRIVCIGYSMPPEDIDMRSMIRWSMGQKASKKSDTEVIVVNPDQKVMKFYRDVFTGCAIQPRVSKMDRWLNRELHETSTVD